ncbi:MAG: GxxExxY protein [Planctomycetaceae bacterium]
MTQQEFGGVAYEVMQHLFAVHHEFGRLFDEIVYKRELAARMDDVQLEVSVDVAHETFTKRYFADAIVGGGGLFEFKAAEAIHARHRAQAINYLLLFGLHHAKIVNTRTEQVQHEFVNCQDLLANLRDPEIHSDNFQVTVPGAGRFRDTLVSLVRDWGTGLELPLYNEALQHFFQEELPLDPKVSVIGSKGVIADQEMRLLAPDVAFKLTALHRREDAFLTHARCLLHHTSLKAILWANLTRGAIKFTTIQ